MSIAQGIPGKAKITPSGKRGKGKDIVHLTDDDYPSVAFICDAMQLVNIYHEHKDALFSLNIRNYIGNTQTNRGLIKTIEEEPEHFYYYNNGISCLAKGIKVSDNDVIVNGLQVINGAQTIKSLHKASLNTKTKEAVKKARVLIRITQAEKQYGSEGRFRDNIVQYNNTQNIIKVYDFRSNDPVQVDIAKKFARSKHRGREIHYIHKRTELRGANIVKIHLKDFVKILFAFMNDPITFVTASSCLYDISEGGGYSVVFGDGSAPYQAEMPEEQFRLRASIYWLGYNFGERLKKEKKEAMEPIDKQALERKWFVINAARIILDLAYNNESYNEDLTKLYKGDWTFGEKNNGKWMDELYNLSRASVILAYKTDSDRSDFVGHRKWMRDKNTPKRIKTCAQSLMMAVGKDLKRPT